MTPNRPADPPLEPLKPAAVPRIGLYSVGLAQYWSQFPGLRRRLEHYNHHIATGLQPVAEVTNAGLVDTPARALEALDRFRRAGVDLIFCHVATYATSATCLPIAQQAGCPVVVLNLQPAAAMNYERTTTGEWLAQCVGCCVPEISNAFERSGIRFHVVTGLLGLETSPSSSVADENTAQHPEAVAAWEQILQWVHAARVRRTLQRGRLGFLGHTYPGMLDMYADLTWVSAQTGLYAEVLEMGDLLARVESVTADQVETMRRHVEALFEIQQDSPTDPLARRPSSGQLRQACRVAVALERLVRDFELDALAYYHRGQPGDAAEALQEASILGHSLLTARGIPCSGEGDAKTALAMKLCDVLGAGGSFSEIVAADYPRGTLLLGHDGPFHLALAGDRPVLRGMGLYHGKAGAGVSVEASVRTGPVTLLNVTQLRDGTLRLITNEGRAIDGPILQIGNTMTHVRFALGPTDFMNRWFALAPTHHGALALGHLRATFEKIACAMGWTCTAVEG